MQGFVKNVARYSIKLRYIQDFDLFVFVLNNFFVFQNEREISPHIVKSLILKLNKQCILRSGQYFHYCSCFRFLRKCACIITLLSVSCQKYWLRILLILTASCKPCPAGHYQSASGTFGMNLNAIKWIFSKMQILQLINSLPEKLS